ncbi:hypothetical protein J132_10477 [Termitomyces sp. J132]|nr:hypothetical protein H2248_005912 [Termitomyces sp. 'cryptogamus']KNZ73676.1 hypothetical protein J132_10477 [Termitomyces sp. J132]
MSRDDQLFHSCFHRLPVELQVEVFEHCMDPYPQFSARAGPLLICSVCSSWREIGQRTPKLWSRFEISIPDFVDDGSIQQNRLNALGLWLERSGHTLLSIRVLHASIDHLPDTRLEQVLTTLAPHAYRLGDICFQTQSSSTAFLQYFLSGHLPELRSVSIDLKGLWRSSFGIQRSGISWDQLRELNITFDYEQLPTLDCYLDVFARCGNLMRCSLTADCVFSRNFTKEVALHHLQHLGLILQSGPQRDAGNSKLLAGSSLVSFFEQLKLPYLSSLNLRWLVKGNHESDTLLWSTRDQSRFISILGSLGPTLRSLSLAYFPFSDKDVLECLLQTQRLSRLELRFSLAHKEADPITDTFLSTITLSIDNSFPMYLPFLETFHIQCHGAHCTILRVLKLIQSRWKPTTGRNLLRRFSFVSLVPISSPQTRDTLSMWSQEGLKVTLEEFFIR